MLTYQLGAVKASLQWDRKATKRTLRIVSGTNLERDHKPRRSPIRDFFRRQSHLTLIVGTHWVDSEKNDRGFTVYSSFLHSFKCDQISFFG